MVELEGCGFEPPGQLWPLYVESACSLVSSWFFLGSLISSRSPKTCKLGELASLKYTCEQLFVSLCPVMIWGPVQGVPHLSLTVSWDLCP